MSARVSSWKSGGQCKLETEVNIEGSSDITPTAFRTLCLRRVAKLEPKVFQELFPGGHKDLRNLAADVCFYIRQTVPKDQWVQIQIRSGEAYVNGNRVPKEARIGHRLQPLDVHVQDAMCASMEQRLHETTKGRDMSWMDKKYQKLGDEDLHLRIAVGEGKTKNAVWVSEIEEGEDTFYMITHHDGTELCVSTTLCFVDVIGCCCERMSWLHTKPAFKAGRLVALVPTKCEEEE